jgi:hypothetical protein
MCTYEEYWRNNNYINTFLKQLNIMRKQLFLSALAVATLLLTSIPAAVYAADDSGSCGANVNYVFTEANGTLVISGTGEMADYYSMESIPWYSYRESIKTVIIENGVTSIGNCAFVYHIQLTSVSMPSSITHIGFAAFASTSINFSRTN